MRSVSGLKFIVIIVLLLFLMMAAVGVSVKLIVNVAKELETVAGEQLPIAQNISRVAELASEQRILLQRMNVPEADGEHRQRNSAATLNQMETLGREALDAFSAIHKEINDGGKPSVPELHRNLALIENLYIKYKNEAELLAATLEAGDRDSYKALLPDLDDIRKEMSLEVRDFQRNLNKMSEKSTALAEEKKIRAWRANTVLMGIAVVLSLGFIVLVFRSKS